MVELLNWILKNCYNHVWVLFSFKLFHDHSIKRHTFKDTQVDGSVSNFKKKSLQDILELENVITLKYIF